MTVSMRGQGSRFHAEGRGRVRLTRTFGQRVRQANRKPARHSPPAFAGGDDGGVSGKYDLPDFAGVTIAYALAWTTAGREFRRLGRGLMVAIKLCNGAAGRIVPDATAVN